MPYFRPTEDTAEAQTHVFGKTNKWLARVTIFIFLLFVYGTWIFAIPSTFLTKNVQFVEDFGMWIAVNIDGITGIILMPLFISFIIFVPIAYYLYKFSLMDTQRYLQATVIMIMIIFLAQFTPDSGNPVAVNYRDATDFIDFTKFRALSDVYNAIYTWVYLSNK